MTKNSKFKKYSKFFLNLEENWAIQNQTRLRKIDEKEIKYQSEILQNLYQFYEELFSKYVCHSN